MQRTPFKTTLLTLALVSLAGMLNAQWVAYNDHVPGTIGTETHANATLYNVNSTTTNTGPLKNIATGATLPVTMTYTRDSGVTFGSGAGVPDAGTPLYTNFNGYVFFGTKTDSAVMTGPGETVTITFTGLDSNKRYSFRGGAVRASGSTSYADRWSIASIEGADTYTSAHSSGALTTAQVPAIPANAAAINTGGNLAGDMWDWEDIEAGADGSFSVVCSQYTGTLPSGGSTAGSYSYAITGLRLEESGPLGPMPITITSQPAASNNVPVGSPLTLSVSITGTTPSYQWFKSPSTAISGATNSTFTIASVTTNDAGRYFVRITNSLNSVVSSDAIVTINTNRAALFVARTPLSAGDLVISNRIAAANYVVAVQDDRTSAASHATGKSLVFISSSVDPVQVANKYASVTVPVIACEPGVFSTMFMTINNTTNNQGTIADQRGIAIFDNTHTLAAGLNGTFAIYNTPGNLSYGFVAGGGVSVATTTNGSGFPVIFAYEKGAALAPGIPAPGRRVGFFLDSDAAPNLTAQGTLLLNSAITWATGTPSTNTPIAITKQPASISVIEGLTGTFQVNVSGTPRYYFQWRKNNNALSGGGARFYTTPPVTQADNGAVYTVFATNSFGQVTSANAVLTVLAPLPIVITNQPDNKSIALGGTVSFTVGITGTSPQYQWYKGTPGSGVAILNATNATYTIPSTTLDSAGTYYVVVSNRVGSATSIGAILHIQEPNQILLPTNFTWKFNTNAVNIPGFYTNGFDDSSWPTGPGAFAPSGENLSGGTLGTILPRYAGGSTNVQIDTVYFRTHFTWSNDPVGMVIVLSNLIDDGAVFYLNGQEIRRIGMPTSGTVNYSTRATRTVDVGTDGWDVFNISPYLFNEGDNVLAVEAHQVNATSTDIVFGMVMSAMFLAPTDLAITNQPTSLSLEEAKSATFSVGVSGDGARYQWYKDGVLLAGQNRDTLTLNTITLGDAGNYYVTVSNAFSFLTSRSAALIVRIDNNPPYAIEADGSETLTNITLTFSEDLLASTATMTNNYILTNVTSGGTLRVLKAVQTTGSNVVLTTAARALNANYVLVLRNLQDNSPRRNLIIANSIVPVTTTQYLIDWTSRWNFYNPTWQTPGTPICEIVPELCDTSHIDQGTLWLQPGYDNPLPDYWGNNAGNEGVFYTSVPDFPAPAGMQLSETPGNIIYFLTHFTNPASPVGLQLQLQYLVDDGAIFYINGVEVHRVNLPATGVIFNTHATAEDTSIALSGFIDIPDSALRVGDNVMQVELHTANNNDIDAYFGMQLVARMGSRVGTPLMLASSPRSVTVVEGQPVTLSFSSVGAQFCQWFQNGVAIPGASNATYTIDRVPLAYNGYTYRVTASNATQSVTTSNAVLTVLADTNPPALLSAYATSATNILVTYSEPMDPSSTTNLLNYTVTNALGQTVLIYRAVLTDGTNVLLTVGNLGLNPIIVIKNVRDASTAKNYIEPNSAAYLGFNLTIPIDATWKYHAQGIDLSNTWRTVSYNDSAWSNGAALLHFETGGTPVTKRTWLPLTNAAGTEQIITYYFRLHFNSPFALANATGQLRHIVDDGAAFYMNGAEFYRFGLSGTINYSTLATSHDAVWAGPYNVTFTNITAGDNVLAAEVHQVNATSTDIVFGGELNLKVEPVIIPPPPPPPPCPEPGPITIEKFVGNQVRLSWTGTNFWLERATALANPYSATAWTPLVKGTLPNNSYMDPSTNAARIPAFYRLRCTGQ